MQVAKGPYKCVPRQLRMTCEPRSSAGTPRFCQSRSNNTGFTEREPCDRSTRDECPNGYGAAPGRVQGSRGGHSAGGR